MTGQMKRRDTGILGEKLAGDFLAKNGYIILETNYRCSGGEIDIIARQADTLVFVEVRTKTSRKFGGPEESITPVKAARLRTLAAHYGQSHEDLPESWRIDVVAVQMNRSGHASHIEIIENAVVDE
jgi:putative endonuclease